MSKQTTSETIERVGAGGAVGEGQAGAPLHKPQGRRDRELGGRERVGAGGPVGGKESSGEKTGAAIDDAPPTVDPDQKPET